MTNARERLLDALRLAELATAGEWQVEDGSFLLSGARDSLASFTTIGKPGRENAALVAAAVNWLRTDARALLEESAKYRKALEDIRQHIEINAPTMKQFSAVYYIANTALASGGSAEGGGSGG